MKKITKSLLLGAIISSTVYGSDINLELGVSNISLGDISETGSTITMRKGNADDGFNLELGYTQGDTIAVTKFGGAYNWEISPKVYAGLNIMANGVGLEPKDSDRLSFIGYSYGVQAKYALSPNNGIIASYNSGTATESSTGLIDYDLTVSTISFSHRF
jgi:hypothetical protein